jgi:hypothetical protein
MTNPNSLKIVLCDTNAAYKLFFFYKKSIIVKNNLSVPVYGTIEFHPIVLDEVTGHIKFKELVDKNNIPSLANKFPSFFKQLGNQDLVELREFIQLNTSSTIKTVDKLSVDFQLKRKLYEAERKRLQARWVQEGRTGRKVKSTPSFEDYALLNSVQDLGLKLLTHDAIVEAIAIEFLSADSTLRLEDVIREILIAKPSHKELIEKVLDNLDILDEGLIRAKIFKKSDN